jgi:SH3 domain protein
MLKENSKMSPIRLNFFPVVFALLVILFEFIHATPAMADTQYVSDLMIISVREGREPDAPVLGYLRSAAQVDVLEETDDLMRIQTEDGLQGWVRKRFIVKDKPKAVIIMELEEKIASLEDDIKTLQKGSDTQALTDTIKESKQRIADLSDSLKNEKKRSSALQEELTQVNTTYQILADKQGKHADTVKELTSLKAENKALQDKIAALPPSNATSVMSGNMKWFLIGSGVLLLGFLIGRSIKGKRTRY